MNAKDYERFLFLLYVANGTEPVQGSHIKDKKLSAILQAHVDRGDPLVEIAAYVLMPNHFHLVLQEIADGGVALFIQKVLTGYTMYFNKKYERTGSLFAGTFKSRHVNDDLYFQQLLSYVHMNPIGLFEPDWKRGVGDIATIKKRLHAYSYSSVFEFLGIERPERVLLGNKVFEIISAPLSLEKMLAEAQAYYLEKGSSAEV